MRDSFDAYVRSKEMDPSKMWSKIEDAIRHVILNKEESIASVLQRYTINNLIEKNNLFHR